MKEIVTQLSYVYPAMFRESEAKDGRRKIDSFDRQATLMCERVGHVYSNNNHSTFFCFKYCEQLRREAKKNIRNEEYNDEAGELPPKKGKLKQVYGTL